MKITEPFVAMSLYRTHVYNPFVNTSFGFFVQNSSFPNDSFGLNVEGVNLYYQPVPPPLTALLFLLVRTLVVVIGEIMHIKVFKKIQNEMSLVNEVTKLYICTQMVYVPFWLLFTTSTDFVHPLNLVIGQWFCTFGWFFIYFCANTLAIHSFIVAIMRYFFIIHKEKVEVFGKQRAKKVFLFLNVLIPSLMILWTGIEGSETEVFSFLNKCYGKDHNRFLTDLSPPDVLQRSFCMLETYTINGPLDEVVSIIRRVSCITVKVVYIVMGFNLTEAILYYKILTHLNRSEKLFIFKHI